MIVLLVLTVKKCAVVVYEFTHKRGIHFYLI